MQLQLSAAPCARIGTAAPAPLAPRDAALLAWLALEGPTPRNHLAALLWPGSPLEQARNTLRQRLFQLKRQLGVALVEGQATLQLAAGVQHDLLDSGDLLADVPLELGGEFAAWLAQQRERRCTRTRQTLADLADMAERARDWPDALAHAAELLALDPLAEGAHRRLMRLHYLAGDRGAALRAFDACEKLLKHEVGARPSAETLALLATVESSSVAAPPPGLADAVPPSVLRPPHMVGRSAELAALAAGWASAQVVAVIAEAGTGKSRLLQEFASARPGVVHMSARPGDAGVPFATLARLLRTVMTRPHAAALVLEPGTRQEVARVVPEMGGGALGLGLGLGMTHGLGGGEGQRLVLQRAVAQLLATQPGLQGLLVDDLHFADQASLDMLLALATDEPHAQGAAPRDPLRWALAYRPAEAGTPLRAFVDALADQAVLRPLPLQPLDLAGLAALVDTLGLPGVHGAALAPGLLRRTGGNPLFVLETIKQSWVERKLAQLADTQLMPRPQSVGRLIERRVLQLSASALAVARVAAIAGVDFCVALAEHVLQAPAMALASAIGELESAQVMRGDAFAHDLVADAVHASVPPTVAVHTHAQVAQWLQGHGGEPARVAAHWIAARQETLALPWLQQAADAAGRALRHRERVAFLQTKARIEEAAHRQEEAFESLHEATQEAMSMGALAPEAVSEALGRLDGLARTPRQQVRAHLLRCGVAAQLGQPQAVAAGEQALAAAQALGDEPLCMHSHRALADACTVAGQFERAAEHGQACVAWFDAHGSLAERAVGHGALALALDNLGRGAQALPHHSAAAELAAQAGDWQQVSVAATNLGRNRIFAGRLPEADTALARAEQVLGSYEGESSHRPQLMMMRALVQCGLGQYGSALALAEQAQRGAQQWLPDHAGAAAVRLASVWWQLGQWARVRQALAGVPAAQLGGLAVRVGHARLAWYYALATGAPPFAARARTDAGGPRQVLQQVLDGMAPGDRPDLRLPLMLDLADRQAPVQALALIAQVRQQAEAAGLFNTLLAAHLRAADIGAEHDVRAARREALAALALHRQGVQTTSVLPAELWLQVARALAAAGDAAHAAEVAEEGRHWLVNTAQTQVPEPFADGFLQANPVNRALLALAARLAA
ncbi:MAG: AAA family ATPase, partial [Rubrivivax sp.]|nr:AAA family ATPase [Rubrivivax sp.]